MCSGTEFEILSTRVWVRNPFAPSGDLINETRDFLDSMGESQQSQVQVKQDYATLRTILLASICLSEHVADDCHCEKFSKRKLNHKVSRSLRLDLITLLNSKS